MRSNWMSTSRTRSLAARAIGDVGCVPDRRSAQQLGADRSFHAEIPHCVPAKRQAMILGSLTGPRILSAAGLVVWLLIGATATSAQSAQEEPTTIGILKDGEWPVLDDLLAQIQAELEILVEGEFEVRFPAEKVADAGWQLELLGERFDDLLGDDAVDLVVTLGLASSQLALNQDRPLTKPVVAPLVIDVGTGNLPSAERGSGVENLTYVSIPNTLSDELATFQEVAPFARLALLVNEELVPAIGALIADTTSLAEEAGVEVSFVPAGRDARSVVAALPAEVDAAYIFPLRQTPEQLGALVGALTERGIATFSGLGREHVELGALATIAPEDWRSRLARRVALNIQRILLGETPAEIPVAYRQGRRLLLNMETLRRLDASPRWEVLLEAERLFDERADLPLLDLASAVGRAVESNLDLAAERLGVAAGSAQVEQARGQFLPSLELSLTGLEIDSESAAASFGSQPKRSWDGGLSLSQVIYSEGVLGNLAIERLLQLGREAFLEQLQLDIALDSSTAYLNLLRARNLVRVQRNNLRLTRANLDLAEMRRDVGAASYSEILRWRSQIASDRQSLVTAESNVQAAIIALNQLLHLPLEEEFRLEDVTLDDETLTPGQDQFRGYIETPKHYATLREFTVARALKRAPELVRLDSSVSAQRRVLRIARRAFWMPDVAAQASLEDRLDESGVGSEIDSPADDSSWSVALSARLTLLGGGRRAAVLAAEHELEELIQLRASTAEKIEQGVRSSMVATRASFTNVTLAQEAASAAAENLELVQDAYARGVVGVLELLDAQSASLQAEIGATDAVHDFFIDLMTLQRVSNRFDFFVDGAARSAWYAELEEYFAERGVEPWRPR